jgi:erythromycin esterase-like protein
MRQRSGGEWLIPMGRTLQRFWRILRFLGSFRGFLVPCALALLVGLGLEWANRPVVAQLRAEAHRISGSPTVLSPADKAYLRRLVGEARVVGLGEGSHGSKEIFEYKAAIIRFLVEEMGFSVLGMESPDDPVANSIIQAGLPDAGELAARNVFPVTREFARLLDWMARYRQQHPERPLDLFGFDAPFDQPGWIPRFITLDDGTRDRLMAENILAVLEKEYPGRKAVLWAHNGHVAFPERAIYPLRGSPMGWYLRQRYGRGYFVLATTFYSGSVLAMWPQLPGVGQERVAMPVFPTLPGTADSAFHRFFGGDFLLDLRAVRPDSPLGRWLRRPQLIKAIGASYAPLLLGSSLATLPAYFDALLFIDKTTAAEPLNPR